MVKSNSSISGIKTFHFLYYRFRYLFNYILIGLLSVLIETIIVRYSVISNTPFALRVGVGFLSGVFLSFILNARLNFKIPPSKNAKTFTVFLIISTVALFLNFLLMEIFGKYIELDYMYMRLITAACIFMISYIAHRRITFDFVKKVGIAVYLNKQESVNRVYSKIKYYADFIHLDLLDSTFVLGAPEVDFSIIDQVEKTWGLKKMLHVMSRKPLHWIEKIYKKVDIIIIHLNIDDSVSEVLLWCKKHGKKTGIAVTIEDKLEDLVKYIDNVDFVQVMGIKNLGPGQPFDPESLDLLAKVRKLQERHRFEIIFDGGVKSTNISRIDTKYIVAISGLINVPDSIKAFLELKTSARYTDVGEILRKDIINKIKNTIESEEYIDSGTIVGSFAEGKKLEGISDIDIVIIFNKLTKERYEKTLMLFNDMRKYFSSNYGYPVQVNSTLGPLKYNQDNIVFHVMMYDKESHKKHCIQSPFTCFDWQRSKMFFKKPMNEIYQVTNLQPNYFFNSRRSAKEYLKELEEETVSFREYIFDKKGNVIEKKGYKKMRERGKIEFTYHIAKFLITNFLKLYYKENKKYPLNEMIDKYFNIFSKNKKRHKKFILEIYSIRSERKFLKYKEVISGMKEFLHDFEEQFNEYFYASSAQVTIMRHAETKMNKTGVYLGRKNDVSIEKQENSTINHLIEEYGNLGVVYSSPLKRALQTTAIINKNQIVVDKRLMEIDYGDADGKDVNYLRKNYPQIIEAWERGEDAHFPNGENSLEVVRRASQFLSDMTKYQGKKVLVITHNVVLRCLIGKYSGILLKEWFKINVLHLEPIKFIVTRDNKAYIELSEEQSKEIFKNL